MLALNHPFKTGDCVSVAGHEGTVKHLDMMAVVLATNDNRKITIPNKQAWGSPIVNYSILKLRRVDLRAVWMMRFARRANPTAPPRETTPSARDQNCRI